MESTTDDAASLLKGRKQIRKLVAGQKLTEETKQAAKAEKEKRQRIKQEREKVCRLEQIRTISSVTFQLYTYYGLHCASGHVNKVRDSTPGSCI